MGSSGNSIASGRPSVLVGEHVDGADIESGIRRSPFGAIRRFLDGFSLTEDEAEHVGTWLVIGILFGMFVMAMYFVFNELRVTALSRDERMSEVVWPNQS